MLLHTLITYISFMYIISLSLPFLLCSGLIDDKSQKKADSVCDDIHDDINKNEGQKSHADSENMIQNDQPIINSAAHEEDSNNQDVSFIDCTDIATPITGKTNYFIFTITGMVIIFSHSHSI